MTTQAAAEPAAEPPRRALLFIVITVFLDSLGIGLFIPVMPVLVMTLTGATLSQAATIGGWLIMAYALAQFLFSPLLGNLSDRFGRRPVLLLSVAGSAVNFLIAAFAPTIAIVFVGRIIAGLFGASYSTAYAYIADVTPPHKRAENFGLVGVAFGLGFIFGPAIGGIIGAEDYRIPFFAAAGLAATNFLLGLFILPESLPESRRRPFDWKRATPLGSLRQLRKLGGPLAGLAIVIFLWQLSIQAQHSIWPYYSAYRYGWTPFEVGVSLASVGMLAVVVNGLLVKRAVRQLGEWRTALIGTLAGATTFAIYGFASVPQLVFLGIAIGAIGGLTVPAMQAMLTSLAPANEQGELQGAIAVLSSISVIIGPPVMSHIFSRFSGPEAAIYAPGAPYYLSSLLALAAAAMLIRQRRIPLTAAATL